MEEGQEKNDSTHDRETFDGSSSLSSEMSHSSSEPSDSSSDSEDSSNSPDSSDAQGGNLANGNGQSMAKSQANEDIFNEDFPEECYHYRGPHELPDSIRKYWYGRRDIFSRYDEGVLFTEEAWYGVTPESVAETIADQMASSGNANKTILIDMFAGVGGNSIAFAKSGRWKKIYAIEKNPAVLFCARYNAAIYGVADKIEFIEGDCMQVLKERLLSLGSKSVVFGSPPWGGTNYLLNPKFDLMTMEPYNLLQLYTSFSEITKDIVLYLPRMSDLAQLSNLAKLTQPGQTVPVFNYSISGYKKAICAFFGNFQFDSTPVRDPG